MAYSLRLALATNVVALVNEGSGFLGGPLPIRHLVPWIICLSQRANMQAKFRMLFVPVLVGLAACASTPADPTLVAGVTREGGGVYSASELTGDPTQLAVRQCALEPGKRLAILTSTTERGIVSARSYAKLVFRCE